MGHVQFILDTRKKAQTDSSSGLKVGNGDYNDLPGFHRRQKIALSVLSAQKQEYNASLRQLRALSKTYKSKKAEEKKEMRPIMDHLRMHKADLLAKIGVYTREERLYGFKEDNHAF